jgi:hypothetical protein
MNDQKITDYIVLWNTGAGMAYIYASIMALVNCIQIQGGFQTSLAVDEGSFGKECAVAIIGLIFSIVITILNIQHARRHFCNKNAKTPVDFAATIGLIVLIGLALTRTISNLASFNNVSTTVYKDYGGAMNVAMWIPLLFDAFCLILAALGLMFMARKAEIEEKIIVRDDSFESGGIAAEVATHAMGHPKPPEELREEMHQAPSQEMNDPLNEENKEEKKKEEEKKVPPLLSADPDNEMLGKINRDNRILATTAPTFADPDDALAMAAKKREEAAESAGKTEEMVKEREEGRVQKEEHHDEKPRKEELREEEKPDIEESLMNLEEADILPVDSLPVDKNDD